MTDRVVTAEEIAAHLQCPRQYEFEFERPISPRSADESGGGRERGRWGELLRGAVVAGLRVDENSPDARTDAALAYLDEHGGSTGRSHLVDEEGEYRASIARAAVESYFASDVGREHADDVQLVDTTLGYERHGIRYEVDVDAVIESGNRYRALRFVPDVSLHLWREDNVEQFRSGKQFYPRQIGCLAAAAIAVRGLASEHGSDPHYEFGYVSLVDRIRPNYGEDGGVDVTFGTQYLGETYRDERTDVDRLVERRADAIVDGATDPRRWQYEEILDRSCEECPYRDACPDHMAHDTAFVDRSRLDEDAQRRETERSRGGDGR